MLRSYRFCFFWLANEEIHRIVVCCEHFDTPSLGFILIPDNHMETLHRAFNRKHKCDSMCNFTKWERKSIRWRETEGDSWGSPKGRAKTWEGGTETILHTLLAAWMWWHSCCGVIWLVPSSARTNSRVEQTHRQERSNKISIWEYCFCIF